MREIKFRAWWKDKKIMLHNVQNFYDTLGQESNGNEKEPESSFRSILAEPHKYIVMQYTGLKDKNGKEIYEGDVVVADEYIWFDRGQPNYRGTVEWVFSQWQVIAHCVNPEKSGISDGSNGGINEEGLDEGALSKWEVIGNIYQNPELIERGEA